MSITNTPNAQTVPLLDIKTQNESVAGALKEAFERVVKSGHFILGPEVEAFERAVAQYLGATHAIGVSSGTDALVVSLMAANIQPGDEVITTPFTFFATAGSIARVGAKPVFVDVDPITFNLDAGAIDGALTSRTKAIMPVHLFGQACDMHAIMAIAKAKQLTVIEDAAQALGTRFNGNCVGTLGDYGCFSFFPSKNLGALGDGGLVTCQSDALAEKVKLLRTHGAKPKYFHSMIGGNFRLDALQAAFLAAKLPKLDTWSEGRARNAEQYTQLLKSAGLSKDLLTVPEAVFAGHIWNQYTLQTPHRDALRKHLSEHNIGSEIYYPEPMHTQSCFSHLGYKAGDFPVSERLAKQSLSIPVFPELSAAQLNYVAETIISFLKSR